MDTTVLIFWRSTKRASHNVRPQMRSDLSQTVLLYDDSDIIELKRVDVVSSNQIK